MTDYLPETLELGRAALVKAGGFSAQEAKDWHDLLAADVTAVLDAVGYASAVARAESAEITIGVLNSENAELHRLLTEAMSAEADRRLEQRAQWAPPKGRLVEISGAPAEVVSNA